MAKVTSKLQITLPKRLVEAHGIAPGDRLEFESSGDDIRIVTDGGKRWCELSREERLRLFDETSRRIQERSRHLPESGRPGKRPEQDKWNREDLYRRGSSD